LLLSVVRAKDIDRQRHKVVTSEALFDTVRIVCGAGSIKRSGVRLSVCPISRAQQRQAAGLLLSVVRAKDIDRQRRATGNSCTAARRSAANSGNVMSTAELTRLNTDLGYFPF